MILERFRQHNYPASEVHDLPVEAIDIARKIVANHLNVQYAAHYIGGQEHDCSAVDTRMPLAWQTLGSWQIMLGNSNGSLAREKIGVKLKPAFIALLEAFDYAGDTDSDPWEFAVALRRFKELGLSESELRWLARKGYVEHAYEITQLEDDAREFRHTDNLSFSKRTCFVLTVAGAEFARALENQDGDSITSPMDSEKRIEAPEKEPLSLQNVSPVWDSERRELRINGDVVKQFKWSAANQEMILAAFEEEHWPVHIDDPLPPRPEQDSKRRLSDTIKCLNRKQKHPLVHFRGDGTGEGIIWERVDPAANGNAAD